MLEAGVHFGHQTRRWNPKMRPFIFTERHGIHIIDLRKTLDRLQAAQEAVRQVTLKGEKVLFVCTKMQLRGIVETEAARSGSFWVTERWLGGMLTNFQTMRKQIRRLRELERGQEENRYEFYTKKERLLLDRERLKLDKYLSGVKEMGRVPGAIFVVDAKRELIAVREAARLGIPVIAIADTNSDPDMIDFPIPGNDDAIRSVSLIAKAIADSIEATRREVPEDDRRADEFETTTYSTETGETTDVEKRPRRKKVRRRRPRPDVIAQHLKGDEEAATAEKAATAKKATAKKATAKKATTKKAAAKKTTAKKAEEAPAPEETPAPQEVPASTAAASDPKPPANASE